MKFPHFYSQQTRKCEVIKEKQIYDCRECNRYFQGFDEQKGRSRKYPIEKLLSSVSNIVFNNAKYTRLSDNQSIEIYIKLINP